MFIQIDFEIVGTYEQIPDYSFFRQFSYTYRRLKQIVYKLLASECIEC